MRCCLRAVLTAVTPRAGGEVAVFARAGITHIHDGAVLYCEGAFVARGTALSRRVTLRGIAQVACDILPLRVLPPIIFSALVYWQAGLHDHPDNFIIFGVVITLVSVWCVRCCFGVRTFICPRTAPQVNLISAAVCLSVGALVRDLCLANLAASLVLLFQLLLCGLLSHNSSTGTTLSTFQRMSFMNYAFEILGNNEFIGAPHAVPRAAWALCSRVCPPVVAGETFNLSPTVPHHKVVPPVRAGPCACAPVRSQTAVATCTCVGGGHQFPATGEVSAGAVLRWCVAISCCCKR